jgi:hypothetical protein
MAQPITVLCIRCDGWRLSQTEHPLSFLAGILSACSKELLLYRFSPNFVCYDTRVTGSRRSSMPEGFNITCHSPCLQLIHNALAQNQVRVAPLDSCRLQWQDVFVFNS